MNTEDWFTQKDIWHLRAAVEIMMDYHRENPEMFSKSILEEDKQLWMKIIVMIDCRNGR